MSKLRQTKTNFTAGELAPELLGRGDLTAYENGAARLRNVFIQPTGGVHRRAGLGHIDMAAGAGRLVSFEFNSEQVYLLVLTNLLVSVYMDGAKVASFASPWTAAHLANIDWTQSADTLLVVHPDVAPQKITRTSHTAWTIAPWDFAGTIPQFQGAAAFSSTRGWPSSVSFHQDRLVIGGSRDLPNHLWMSRVGAFFNFNLGTGLDDEAIHFEILSDRVDAIRNVFSGRHLQVFTTGGEWMVTGEPLTPRTVQIRRQTRVGSLLVRRVPPRDVDGATLFAAASGRELREFLFADAEQAYQAADLALLARHLVNEPVDMDYDPLRRLVHLVMADGSLATVTNFRREKVTAWTGQETAGQFLSVAVVGTETYAMVQRGDVVSIEVFEDDLGTDSALTGTSEVPKLTWSGLDHLEGQSVKVKADGVEVDNAVVTEGAITLAYPAKEVEVGLPFTHSVEPLPVLPDGPAGGGNGRQMRLVRVSLRVLDTPVLHIDTGRGPTAASFKRFGASGVLDAPPPPFTGDVTVRALGWQRNSIRPLWSISQDTPHPCCVLSVTTETKVTN